MPILNFYILDEENNIERVVSYDSSITFEEFALDYLRKQGYYVTLNNEENIFVLKGKILNRQPFVEKTLGELIKEDEKVMFIRKHHYNYAGGYDFGIDNKEASNEEVLVKGNYNKDAAKWNIITKGLNVRGKCENHSCEAYNEKVDCQIGLGIFDVEKDYGKIKCPMCKERIHPLTCYFCECKYKIEGKHVKGGENIEVSKPWKTVEKDFEYYDPEKKGITEWSTLIIETKPL